jgi:hypothetical protein
MGIFEAAGCEMNASAEIAATHPTRLKDAPFAGAGRLYPAKRFGTAAAIVRREQDVPCSHGSKGKENVDD